MDTGASHSCISVTAVRKISPNLVQNIIKTEKIFTTATGQLMPFIGVITQITFDIVEVGMHQNTARGGFNRVGSRMVTRMSKVRVQALIQHVGAGAITCKEFFFYCK